VVGPRVRLLLCPVGLVEQEESREMATGQSRPATHPFPLTDDDLIRTCAT
jgi:hypothetical protein